MKKLIVTLMVLVGTMSINAQVIKVMKGDEVVAMFSTSTADKVVFEETPTPKYVDLGLPSGTLWATYNIGAIAPWDYGYYLAWGETEEKTKYDEYTYFDYYPSPYGSYIKYNNSDGKTVLDAEDDVAHVMWGGKWRMPTSTEFIELSTKCGFQKTTMNGVSGYKVTGTNGNSIFLPFASGKDDKGYIEEGGGYYWTCDLSKDDDSNAYLLNIADYSVTLPTVVRHNGYSVRPVWDSNIITE